MIRVAKLPAYLQQRLGAVRKAPLLILLILTLLGWSTTSQADSQLPASTVANQASIQVAALESTLVDPSVLEESSPSAEGFDFSLLLVMVLGIGGLIWMRRHIQNL